MAERIIETGLKGPIQKDILLSILGQISDGYWQNSPRMDMYWKNIRIDEQAGNVIIVVNDQAFPWYAMSDEDILQFFGKKIKFLIKKEFEGNKGAWKRTNTKDMTIWLSHAYPSKTSVSDCYQAYDILMGRRTDNKTYNIEENVFDETYKNIITEGYYRRRSYYNNRNYTGDWDDQGPVRRPGERWSRTQWDQQMEWLRRDAEESRKRYEAEKPMREAQAKELMQKIEADPSILDDYDYCDDFWRKWWLSEFLTPEFKEKFQYKIDAMFKRAEEIREEKRKKGIY